MMTYHTFIVTGGMNRVRLYSYAIKSNVDYFPITSLYCSCSHEFKWVELTLKSFLKSALFQHFRCSCCA